MTHAATAPLTVTIRLAKEPDSDGDYRARVYVADVYSRTFYERVRADALAKATDYAAWLREHDASEEVIEV